MLVDIVIDTNVLEHANNPAVAHYVASCRLIRALETCSTLLCVDEGFALDAAGNRSLIGAEYIGRLRFGTLGLALVAKLATSKRICQVSRTVDVALARKVNQMIRKPRDRTFLKVALNSVERVVVSHDYEDFQQGKRDYARKELDLRIESSEEVLGAL